MEDRIRLAEKTRSRQARGRRVVADRPMAGVLRPFMGVLRGRGLLILGASYLAMLQKRVGQHIRLHHLARRKNSKKNRLLCYSSVKYSPQPLFLFAVLVFF